MKENNLYLTFRIVKGFIVFTLAIIVGLFGFFISLRGGYFVWQYLAVVACGVLGEFICYAMYKNRSKKEKENKNNNEND